MKIVYNIQTEVVTKVLVNPDLTKVYSSDTHSEFDIDDVDGDWIISDKLPEGKQLVVTGTALFDQNGDKIGLYEPVVELADKPPEAPPVLPAWRVRAIARITDIGGTMLHDIIMQAIEEETDPLTKVVMEEIYLGGNELSLTSPMLVAVCESVGIDEEARNQLFIQGQNIIV